MRVWLINFDFGYTETAVNIGYSCHLLTDDLIDVFVVDGTTHDEVEKQLLKFKESVKIVNTFHIPGETGGSFARYNCRQLSEKCGLARCFLDFSHTIPEKRGEQYRCAERHAAFVVGRRRETVLEVQKFASAGRVGGDVQC